jgi:hypothetical protein
MSTLAAMLPKRPYHVKLDYLDSEVAKDRRAASQAEAAAREAAALAEFADLPAHLERVAAHLERVSERLAAIQHVPVDFRSTVVRVIAAVAALVSDDRVETPARLQALDDQIVDAAVAALDPLQLRAEAERQLQQYRRRLPSERYEAAVRASMSQLARQKFGLPVLTWERGAVTSQVETG